MTRNKRRLLFSLFALAGTTIAPSVFSDVYIACLMGGLWCAIILCFYKAGLA